MDSGENINDVDANVCDKEEAADNGDADYNGDDGDDCDTDNDNGNADNMIGVMLTVKQIAKLN